MSLSWGEQYSTIDSQLIWLIQPNGLPDLYEHEAMDLLPPEGTTEVREGGSEDSVHEGISYGEWTRSASRSSLTESLRRSWPERGQGEGAAPWDGCWGSGTPNQTARQLDCAARS